MDAGDRALIARLQAGDGGAAVEVEGWVRVATAPFRSRLRHEWEDAVQDALVEVLEALGAGAFHGQGSLRGYVWRTSVRSCLDRLRRRRRWTSVEIDESMVPPVAATALADLVRGENRDRLLALLARLPRSCRELWREILLGRSYRQMSERLGVSEGALRVRVLRCRRRALDLAAREGGGNGGPGAAP